MPSLSNPSSSSAPTRKRIPCSQIRAGMFLVGILDSWWKSPFFIHRRLLRPQDVQLLVQSGIHEVEIDTSKGHDVLHDSEGMHLREALQDQFERDAINHREDSCKQESGGVAPDSYFLEPERHERLTQLRVDTIAALGKIFEGVKTGEAIPFAGLLVIAQNFVQHALAHPTVLAEILLVDHLERFDKTLYTHVVDTAVLSILMGLQLGWDPEVLKEVAVAALLHDVGYMRLPLNLVKTRWGSTGVEGSLLQQHVDIGLTLINRKSGCSPDIVHMIRAHHAYQDGSGYPHGQGGESVSASGKLLGLADYFDELLAEGNLSGYFPAALAIRRIYQEAQRGKFPIVFVEAMIRVFGVYPVGTFVELSTGDQAVVVKQSAEVSVKPYVKIIRTRNGRMLDEPEMKNLALVKDLGEVVRIEKILASGDASKNLRKYFS